MRSALCLLVAALCLAGAAHAMQPGASGSLVVRNGVVDLIEADGGDSTSGTTRAANKPKLKQRRADSCAAQTDGESGELCLDDFSGLWQCTTTTCNAAGWALVGTGRLIPSTQTLAAASTQITVTTSYRAFTLTPSGTTTLTATPTIATSGVTQGTLLLLENLDGTTTDCAVFRDKSILASSGLSLRASTRTLCPGRGGLFLIFNGTDWTEVAPGTVRVLSGSTDKGLLDELILNSAQFSVTGNTIALTSSVTLLDNTIEPSETTGAFAFTNAAQTFTLAQTVRPRFTVQDATGVSTYLDCGTGFLNLECLVLINPVAALGIAPKQYVDTFTPPISSSIQVAFGGATSSDGFRLQRYWVGHGSAGYFAGAAVIPMTSACTTREVRAVLTDNTGATLNVPTNNRLDVFIRKNVSATNQATCSIAAGSNTCSATSLTNPVFALGNTLQFSALCVDVGTACTTTTAAVLSVSVRCTG